MEPHVGQALSPANRFFRTAFHAVRDTRGRIGNAHASTDRYLPQNVIARARTALRSSPTPLAGGARRQRSSLLHRAPWRFDSPLRGHGTVSGSIHSLGGRRRPAARHRWCAAASVRTRRSDESFLVI